MEDTARQKYMVGLVGVGAAIVALLFLPFAGFEEKLTYHYQYAITGVGTYGDEFFLFEYPRILAYVQYLLIIGAAVLLFPLVRLWRAVRTRVAIGEDILRRDVRIMGFIGAGAVVLLILATLVLLPMVEDETIWNVDSAGFLTDWWPGYGAFTAIGASAVATLMLRGAISASPPVPIAMADTEEDGNRASESDEGERQVP